MKISTLMALPLLWQGKNLKPEIHCLSGLIFGRFRPHLWRTSHFVAMWKLEHLYKRRVFHILPLNCWPSWLEQAYIWKWQKMSVMNPHLFLRPLPTCPFKTRNDPSRFAKNPVWPPTSVPGWRLNHLSERMPWNGSVAGWPSKLI